MRFRAVSWVLFPALAILYVFHGWAAGIGFKEIAYNSGLNLAFLAVVFLLVWLYISLRRRRWTHLPDKLIGWGDILFLLGLCFYFTLLNFILFYIISLLMIILFWLVWANYKPDAAQRHIPLAGLQAIILSAFLMLDWLVKGIDLTSDNWLLFLMSR
jgi:hypothetical protein